jgi:DNA (cytosine-5)-methyltransferase 1
LPTPCARDGKGPGHQYGLPDLVEPHGTHGGLLPTPTAVGYGSNRSCSPGATRRPGLAKVASQLLPTPRATDGVKGCPGQRGSHGDLTLPSAAVGVPTLPTLRASDARGPAGHGDGGADLRTTIAGLGTLDQDRWGVYAAAVARWELLLGRPVPEPTQPGIHGRPVLAPPFVEWLMGLPHGWVTGLGLPRTAALRVLGNGVVVAQAAVALRLLLCPHRWAVNS